MSVDQEEPDSQILSSISKLASQEVGPFETTLQEIIETDVGPPILRSLLAETLTEINVRAVEEEPEGSEPEEFTVLTQAQTYTLQNPLRLVIEEELQLPHSAIVAIWWTSNERTLNARFDIPVEGMSVKKEDASRPIFTKTSLYLHATLLAFSWGMAYILPSVY